MAEQLILYHRTSKENVESILKNGLLRNKAKSLKCIYLSKYKDTSFGDVLFEVILNSNKYPKCYRLSDWEHIVFHDISPEDITLIEVDDEERINAEAEDLFKKCKIHEYNSKMKEKEAYKLYFDEAYKYTNFYEEGDE